MRRCCTRMTSCWACVCWDRACGRQAPPGEQAAAAAHRRCLRRLSSSPPCLLPLHILLLRRDLAVLATEGVSSQAADTLQKDGWKVHRVGLLANPGTWTQEASQARHRRRPLQFVL
jgi:hypothetical protein